MSDTCRHYVSSERVITRQVIPTVEEASCGNERVCRKCLFPYAIEAFELYTHKGKRLRRRTCRYCCAVVRASWTERNRQKVRRQGAAHMKRRRESDPAHRAYVREYDRRRRAEAAEAREQEAVALLAAGYEIIKVLASRYFISKTHLAKLCRAGQVDATWLRGRWYVREASLQAYIEQMNNAR